MLKRQRKDSAATPGVAAAERARAAALTAVLAQGYDLKLPAATVGAKRARPAAVDSTLALQHAEATLYAAEERKALAQRTLDEQPPLPPLTFTEDLDDEIGEATVLRRYCAAGIECTRCTRPTRKHSSSRSVIIWRH